jgi:hypothetical protein
MAGFMNGGALIATRSLMRYHRFITFGVFIPHRRVQLYAGPNTPPIAAYRHFPQATPIGPSHGTLEYNFTDGLFLLEVLLALNLNRWLDWNLE